ncbi:hypothetical protein [Hymenobacter swuensis]|uniref:Uncharacterized protein n=1 Tax=Hymenobacter swuensis DY53 TaxID=1227739 RepID=W8F3P6_9BACT|nr:hypothetical protein [Hymenobacter swuensis]AHJ99578.1 hypothetical protein Hsw_3983 [Hymenobacter swuensis DY53]
MKSPLDWLRRSKPAPNLETLAFRDTLFGDAPAEQWPTATSPSQNAEPWQWFVQAREASRRGHADRAEQLLRQVLSTPNLEVRHYLQAWAALSSHSVLPGATEAKQVLGVVVEVALTQGPDVVAAYTDGSARYLNQSGKIIIWEKPDSSLDQLVSTLLAAGQQVASQIGPWEGERPAPPTGNTARVSFLTPSGLHFGEGPMDVLWQDALAHPVLAAAQALMIALMEKSQPGITLSS